MTAKWNRREVLKGLAAASAAGIVPSALGAAWDDSVAARPVEVQITALSPSTLRLSILPVNAGVLAPIPSDGSLVRESWDAPITKLRAQASSDITAGNFRVKISFAPVTVEIKR